MHLIKKQENKSVIDLMLRGKGYKIIHNNDLFYKKMESNDLILEELKKYEARTKAELLEIQNTAIKRPLVKKEKDLIFTLQSNLISANNLIKTFEDPSSEERPNSQNEMNDKFI